MIGEPIEMDRDGADPMTETFALSETSTMTGTSIEKGPNGVAPGHILLVGFMGSGKSTAALGLAMRHGKASFDMDMDISRVAGKSIPEIFADEGEQGFRARERDCLERLRTVDPTIVSCGGGVVTSPENRELLKTLGFVVFLEVDPAEALSRIASTDSRPILASGADPAALLAERMPMYLEVADMRFDTTGKRPDQVASELGAELVSRGLL